MSFHLDKCNVLQVTWSGNPLTHDYILHNQIRKEKDAVKYLGITVHHKLSWNEHICSVVKKANSSKGFLRQNLQIHRKHIKANAYTRLLFNHKSSMHLLYGIFSPRQENQNKIEMAQRRASCLLCLQQLQTRSKCH